MQTEWKCFSLARELITCRAQAGTRALEKAVSTMVEPVFHSRQMRAIGRSGELVASRGRLLLQQLTRLQVRAVELIQDGKVDRAIEELREGFSLMMELIRLAPPGLNLDVQLGYLYKTIAQALDASGDRTQTDHYLELADSAFQRIKEAGASERRSVEDIANAVNGIGNVYHGRGELEKAIRYYRLAVEIEPRYAYAWYELFVAGDALARKGRMIDVGSMREALAKVIEAGSGLPGLGNDKIAMLRGSLIHWEHATGSAPKPTKTTPSSRTKSKRKSTSHSTI